MLRAPSSITRSHATDFSAPDPTTPNCLRPGARGSTALRQPSERVVENNNTPRTPVTTAISMFGSITNDIGRGIPPLFVIDIGITNRNTPSAF